MIVCKKLIFLTGYLQLLLSHNWLAGVFFWLQSKVNFEDEFEVGERKCSLMQFTGNFLFWLVMLWKEICAGPWHHYSLCAVTVGWNTDAIILLYVFDTWNCDSKLGKVLWISCDKDVIALGKGYLLTKARIINPLQEFVSFDYPCSVLDRLHLTTL